MSDARFIKLWLATQRDLQKLIQVDRSVSEDEPVEDRQEAIRKILPVYYQYRNVVQRLTVCHDETVQPQVRQIMRKTLDCSIVRMLEYRLEIVNLTCLECPWSNDYLLDARLTPDDVDLRAPLYDTASRLARFQSRARAVEDLKKSKAEDGASGVASTGGDGRSNEDVTMIGTDAEDEARDRAILLIQSHERARVSRRIVKTVELRRKRDEKLASEEAPAPEIDPVTKAKAATVVQKAWRSYVARREVKRKHDRLLEILGLAVPSWNPNGYLLRDGEASRKANMDAQLRAAQRLEETIASERRKIRENHGLRVIEDVQDEIRQWFFLWFEEIGYFDSLPPQEIGGSKLIATGQSRTPAEYLSGLTADNKPKGNTKKEETSVKEEKEEEEEEKELGWSMPESKVLAHLEGAIDEFGERWAHRVDALLGSGGLLVDLVQEDLHYELQLEMRGVADELAREELDKLNRGLAADLALEGLPFTPPAPQFDVLKPAKESKNQKKKKEAPVEAPLEEAEELSILLELLEDGVLRLPGSSDGEPEAKLSEWPGVVSVALGPECRLGDLKQPVLDYCVLPVGSRSVHELAPLVRSVCLCGPAGSGQDFLARAICAELKAAVFDLTPEKHVGRFLGRDGRNRLIRSVVRLAKAYAPSVVLVRGESAWLKKLPAELRPVQPKRFAPIYQKIVNSIKPGDQVLFLTTSSEPYLASAQFTKLHDKFIVVPIADRSSLYRAYKLSLMALHGIDRNLELSALARLTSGPQGTPIELVPEIIARALPATRRIQLKRRPLRPEELLEQWLLVDRPEDAQLNGLEKFRAKLPLEGKRRKLEEAEQEGLAQPAGKKKK